MKEIDESLDALDDSGQHGLLTLTADFDSDHGRPSLTLRVFQAFQDFDEVIHLLIVVS